MLQSYYLRTISEVRETLDISRYNIHVIPYCTQHNNFEGKTAVTLRTHERNQYLALTGELWMSFMSYLEKRWPRDIGSALYNPKRPIRVWDSLSYSGQRLWNQLHKYFIWLDCLPQIAYLSATSLQVSIETQSELSEYICIITDLFGYKNFDWTIMIM